MENRRSRSDNGLGDNREHQQAPDDASPVSSPSDAHYVSSARVASKQSRRFKLVATALLLLIICAATLLVLRQSDDDATATDEADGSESDRAVPELACDEYATSSMEVDPEAIGNKTALDAARPYFPPSAMTQRESASGPLVTVTALDANREVVAEIEVVAVVSGGWVVQTSTTCAG